MGFAANFIHFPEVKNLGKSVKIWQSYRNFQGGNGYTKTYGATGPYRALTCSV